MNHISKFILFLFGLLLCLSCYAKDTETATIRVGAERIEVITRLLAKKQVGLVVNQTSVLDNGQRHLLDVLLEEGINVVKVKVNR